MITRNPPPSAPPTEKGEKRNGKSNAIVKADNQKKALQNLDQMVKNIYETELPGMCSFMPPPPNSRSDGYLQGACK